MKSKAINMHRCKRDLSDDLYLQVFKVNSSYENWLAPRERNAKNVRTNRFIVECRSTRLVEFEVSQSDRRLTSLDSLASSYTFLAKE